MALALVVGLIAGATPNESRAEVPATILLIGDVPETGAIAAARNEMPASWRIARLVPPVKPPPPADESRSLARAYFDADFLRCLTNLQSSALDVDRLLEHDRRDEAARVGTLAAACALGAGDKPRAHELVRRLFVRGLEDQDTLRQTTPEFQALVDEERSAVSRLNWVTVEVHSDPDRGSVHVDGVLRCRNAPCRVHVIAGEHLITAERLGRRPRAVAVELDQDQQLTLALDDAPAEDVRHQLLAALSAGIERTDIELDQAASAAFGARVLVLVWQEQTSVHATAYDRTVDRVVAHVAIDAGPDAVPAAIRAAVHEERGVGSGAKPMLRQPFFWLSAAGIALLTGTIVFMANRPTEVRHEIVFP
jgi:hypothetical protein